MIDLINNYMRKINRINRKFYIQGIILLLLLSIINSVMFTAFWSSQSFFAFFSDIFFLIFSTFIAILVIKLAIKRLHDFNASGWWLLIFLPSFVLQPDIDVILNLPIDIILNLPFANLFFSVSYLIHFFVVLLLFFKKSDADKNKYGEPLMKNSNFFATLFSKDFLSIFPFKK